MPHRNGAIDWSHMDAPFLRHKVKIRHHDNMTTEAVKKIVDRGNIAIIVYNTARISRTSGDPRINMTGRYYDDDTGHYSIVKGYTLDGRYFIVYDPIPSDWARNAARYSDGQSMLGRNRFYPVTEIARTMGRRVIEVMR